MSGISLVEEVHRFSKKRLGRLPDLDNPKGYNDQIQWLKLFDQRAEQVVACDKWAVREMVAARAGADVLIPATSILPPWSYPAIAKTTHDSGGNAVLLSLADVPEARRKLAQHLSRPYGVGKGEWAYRLIKPRIMVEDLLEPHMVDYKFHCAHGAVKWVQVIWNRRRGQPREAIFLPDGSVTDLQMDEQMEHCPFQSAYPGDRAWAVLTRLAERLSAGWRYVRVDLYWSRGQAWFGELTFWPRAGAYRSKDEPTFGTMLGLDLSEKFEPVYRGQ